LRVCAFFALVQVELVDGRPWVAFPIFSRSCSLSFKGKVSRTWTAQAAQQLLFSTWKARPFV
jgi:hypothetical protein